MEDWVLVVKKDDKIYPPPDAQLIFFIIIYLFFKPDVPDYVACTSLCASFWHHQPIEKNIPAH